ncbi:MAG: hypothetical protein K6T17_07310 [Fimbriimonadales bacterium]|nr:hypothetical protein [Fimbriimonadales bacterium]
MSVYSYAPGKIAGSPSRERVKVSQRTWVGSLLALVFLASAVGFRVGCFFAGERARENAAALTRELREAEQALARLRVSLELGQMPTVISEWAQRHRFVVPVLESQYARSEL